MTGRRIAAVPLAGLLAAAALTAAAAGQHRRDVATDGQRPYVDPLGWSLAHPRSMYIERSSAQLRISVSEVTIAGFPPLEAVRSGHTRDGAWLRVDPPRNRQGVFPAGGVAFRIVSREGGPAPDVSLPETRFPIRLSGFQPSSAYPDTKPRPVELRVVANGRNYLAQAWIGAHASPAARASIARVASSLTFRRLRVGETVGYGFRVLEPASRYPVGSFVRVRAERQAFYLVHAPHGFYAIGWRRSLVSSYRSRCDLRVDRRAAQFYCTNLTARWDRVGRVLVRPHGASRDDPLTVSPAKVAWDGHVLLVPGVSIDAARDADRLWRG